VCVRERERRPQASCGITDLETSISNLDDFKRKVLFESMTALP
jgi:hypothetical protein